MGSGRDDEGGDPAGGGDGLESLFAAEEAAIRDDGFSARVMAEAERAPERNGLRRLVIFAAGGLGLGVASTGLSGFAGLNVFGSAVRQASDDLVAAPFAGGAGFTAEPWMLLALAGAAAVAVMLAAAAMQEN